MKKVAHKVAFSRSNHASLTPKQAEVLHLLTVEYLTPKQIANRRGTKVRSVQHIIQKLKDLGLVNKGYEKLRFLAPTSAIFENDRGIRLHGEEWCLRILYKDHRYKDLLKRANYIEVDGNTVRLSRDSVEVYSGKSFFGEGVDKVTIRSFEYWNRFFRKLEDQLEIILVKKRVQNVRRVNAHYAEINNELAKDYEERGDKIKVYTRDDGKLWFTVDNSFNLHEAECLHPLSSKEDMGLVRDFFNDVRDGGWKAMRDVTTEFAINSKEYAENIKKHLAVMDEMSKTLKKIQKSLK